MSEDDTTFGRQAQNESAPRKDAHEAYRPNVPAGELESFTPELPPEAEPERQAPEDTDQVLGQLYNLMLDGDEETARSVFCDYLGKRLVEAYRDAKTSNEAHTAEQLKYFQKTHICLPATDKVVDYVNTIIDRRVEDESTPENSRADVALKMISALYD